MATIATQYADDAVSKLRGEVTNTVTQMKNDPAAEITRMRAEVAEKVTTKTLGEHVTNALMKLVNDRLVPMETLLMKLQSDAKTASSDGLRDGVIEKTSYGKPFIFKADGQQSLVTGHTRSVCTCSALDRTSRPMSC